MQVPKDSLRELDLHLRAGYKLIHFCTQEERRAELELVNLAIKGKRPREYYSWKCTEGFLAHDEKPVPNCKESKNPVKALTWIMDREKSNCPVTVYVLKDFHPFISNRGGASVEVLRKLKDVIYCLESRSSGMVILGPPFELPVELEKEVIIIDFKLPTVDELFDCFQSTIKANQLKISNDDDIRVMARAAKGLTACEAELAFGKVVVKNGSKISRDNASDIAEEKKQIIRKTGILTIEEPVEFKNVGGLEILRKWLDKRLNIFSEEARDYGIPSPKGILLSGVPGCGKSLCAKSMADHWKIPLLRLDMGAVFGSLVGASEANMRRALQSAEAMAPCILMIDEIEKGMAGISGGEGGGDGGTGSRVFGTLLSWMNDKTAPVFVVATANQFDRLPPEMLRKGRFDELFFVDFPHHGERKQIFRIHVRKAFSRRNPPCKTADIDSLLGNFGFDEKHVIAFVKKDGQSETRTGTICELSEKLTGSEIEEAVKSAMIEAFHDGKRPFNSKDVAKAISNTVPLFETMTEKIEGIRRRASECMVSASYDEEQTANNTPTEVPRELTSARPVTPTRGGRVLDI